MKNVAEPDWLSSWTDEKRNLECFQSSEEDPTVYTVCENYLRSTTSLTAPRTPSYGEAQTPQTEDRGQSEASVRDVCYVFIVSVVRPVIHTYTHCGSRLRPVATVQTCLTNSAGGGLLSSVQHRSISVLCLFFSLTFTILPSSWHTADDPGSAVTTVQDLVLSGLKEWIYHCRIFFLFIHPFYLYSSQSVGY